MDCLPPVPYVTMHWAGNDGLGGGRRSESTPCTRTPRCKCRTPGPRPGCPRILARGHLLDGIALGVLEQVIPGGLAIGDLSCTVVEVLLELAGVQYATLAIYALYRAVGFGKVWKTAPLMPADRIDAGYKRRNPVLAART